MAKTGKSMVQPDAVPSEEAIDLPEDRHFRVTLRDGRQLDIVAHAHTIADTEHGVMLFSLYERAPKEPGALLQRVTRVVWSVVDVEELFKGSTQGGVQ